MNDKDKTRTRGPDAGADATKTRGDRTAVGGRDATRRPTPDKGSPDTTTFRPRPAGAKPDPGAIDDATRVRPAAPRPPAAAAEPQPGGQTRVRGGAPSATAQPASINVDQHQVLKGRFTLEKVIGVGGMGVVYRALDRLKVEAQDREPHVAIKVLSEEFKAHPESFVALQRESRKTQRISHPNVVKVFDFDRDGDVVFMTMEYMKGRPLDEIIKQHHATGLPRDEAWTILNGLCSALSYAHNENIVHSDFKPGNIFITDTGMPKIFDFGIARAVANVDRASGRTRDVTVFDAGTLGALTPAYASLEMLVGEQPDVRDDIYALGCIAYEILTGEHPYGRLPADEAMKRGLRPERIPGIKRSQWKVIEKALAFRRKDRCATVKEFHDGILAKGRSLLVVGATAVVVLTIVIAAWLVISVRSAPQNQAAIQIDEIEFGIRYNLFKEKIEKLLADPTFTEAWESSLWDEYSEMKKLLTGRTDKWFNATTETIFQLYLRNYRDALAKENYKRAEGLLLHAYRYTTDTDFLDAEKAKLAELMRNAADKLKAQDDDRARAAEARQAQVTDVAKRTSMFELALKNVNQQLRCEGNLSMRDFGVAVDKLRETDPARYRGLETNIVANLATCIIKTGKSQPERGQEAKTYAMRIFPGNSVIAGITIKGREVCDKSMAGLGARGESAVCRDKVQGATDGPVMVVVPATGNIQAFAIGKYEVSVREFNQFCKLSKSCSALSAADEYLPATKIDIDSAVEYARWLSRSTGQKYRLPTRTEWMYAANATTRSHDPNRNCAFNTHGIEKGGQLVRVNVGTQNSWGLVNYLGNAQEWVYDKGRTVVAVGGSYEDAMAGCNVEAVTNHSGKPDNKTGFRVVREITN